MSCNQLYCIFGCRLLLELQSKQNMLVFKEIDKILIVFVTATADSWQWAWCRTTIDTMANITGCLSEVAINWLDVYLKSYQIVLTMLSNPYDLGFHRTPDVTDHASPSDHIVMVSILLFVSFECYS